MTHFDSAITAFGETNDKVIEFGQHAMKAIDDEKRTIRELSEKLCGNAGLEDRIGRYIMAARWLDVVWRNKKYRALYEDIRHWLTPSHFTELWKLSQIDNELAFDSMEQCLVRNVTESIKEAKPVTWLRAKRAPEREPAEMFHRLWMFATKTLPDAYSELERKGRLATKNDRIKVRLLELVIKYFSAVEA